jgi:hypothetical protein
MTALQRNALSIEYKKWESSFAYVSEMRSFTAIFGTVISDAQAMDTPSPPDYVQYEHFYKWANDDRLIRLLSLMHSNLVNCYNSMNSRLPTSAEGAHFWADPSRTLIATIDTVEELTKTFANSAYDFIIADEYRNSIDICKIFLCSSDGSTIPPHTSKMPVYLEIPIFTQTNVTIAVATDTIKRINREYIKGLTDRALSDISSGSYDSAITKSRTLLEEVFCFVIEKGEVIPSDKGDIGKLYGQVKTLYHMHQDKEADTRINMLLSGLEKIVSSIAEMRNKGSDSHGVGAKRVKISEHHARLFVNSATVMAEFILAVEKKARQSHQESR